MAGAEDKEGIGDMVRGNSCRRRRRCEKEGRSRGAAHLRFVFFLRRFVECLEFVDRQHIATSRKSTIGTLTLILA